MDLREEARDFRKSRRGTEEAENHRCTPFENGFRGSARRALSEDDATDPIPAVHG